MKRALCLCWVLSSVAWGAVRARDLGIVVGRYPTGKWNAITDVPGVKVGHVTLNRGSGKLKVGEGPVRTGVTVIHPVASDVYPRKPTAGSFVLNGAGEAMGLMWVREAGYLESPIALTNTHAVADAQKGVLAWMRKSFKGIGTTDDTVCPVVLECDDSTLNDINGNHVTAALTAEALDGADTGPVAEGNVGAGTGMISYDFKAGIGTSSRVLPQEEGGYTVGLLLNANHGRRPNLRVLGAPVGLEIADLLPGKKQEGSVVVILATDAPLDSRQLGRLAKRTMLGIARTGAVAYHGSGDIALAFSTKNRMPHYPKKIEVEMKVVSDFHLGPLVDAAADAAEEAILNALVAAKTMEGRDGVTVHALPHDRLKASLKKHRLLP